MSNHKRLINKLEKLAAEIRPIAARRLEVRRRTDRALLYAVGDGEAHQVLAVESQVDYLRGLGKRVAFTGERRELLLGDRRSGTTWAGIVATVSLAIANVTSACIYTNPHLVDDTHRLLREILPAGWADGDAADRGFCRLPAQARLHVVSYKQPKAWPDGCEVVMLNDYAYATKSTIEEVLARGRVRIVTGNPPLEGEPGRDWALRERDRAKAAGMLFRFRAEQNQSLMGDVRQSEEIFAHLAPEAERFWVGTGL